MISLYTIQKEMQLSKKFYLQYIKVLLLKSKSQDAKNTYKDTKQSSI